MWMKANPDSGMASISQVPAVPQEAAQEQGTFPRPGICIFYVYTHPSSNDIVMIWATWLCLVFQTLIKR